MRKVALSAALAVSVCFAWISCGLNPCGYGADSMSFDSICVDSVIPISPEREMPAMTIGVHLLCPKDGNKQSVASVENMIMTLVAASTTRVDLNSGLDGLADKLVSAYAVNYRQDWSEECENYRDGIDASNQWLNFVYQLEGTPVYNAKGILSYQLRSYNYEGGVHGTTISLYGVYDLHSNEQVFASTLVDEENTPALVKLLEAAVVKFFEGFGAETIQDLRDSGILFDNVVIEPTNNFYLDEKGITWVYNVYEIAPYVVGDIRPTILWEDVKPLLSNPERWSNF